MMVYQSELFLNLDDVCPSIRLRMMRNQKRINSTEERILLNHILGDTRVRQVLLAQRKGWFFQNFHGFNSMESSVRFLLEMGFAPTHPVLSQAADALMQASEAQLLGGIGKPGLYLDEHGCSSSRTIQAWLLAELGCESETLVREAVERALGVMDYTRQVSDIDAISCIKGNYRILNPHSVWPDLYHFRLLAACQGWRTPRNLQVVTEAVAAMLRLQPVPSFHIIHKGQIIAPASFGLQDLLPEFDAISDRDWMPWLQRMILFARMDLLNQNATLKQYTQAFITWLAGIGGWQRKPINHTYFSNWGAYTGLMLEKDWRSPARRINDLIFRTFQITAGLSQL